MSSDVRQDDAPRRGKDTSSYMPIFGVNDGMQTAIPPWLPITLLAVTTATLIVPIALIRRQRANLLDKSLKTTPAPPRRTGAAIPLLPAKPKPSDSAPPPRRPSSYSSVPLSVSPVSGPARAPVAAEAHIASTRSQAQISADNFNGALYSAKAFGIATALVWVGAGVSVWGVKSIMGVQDTEEFAQRMRSFILTRMPVLASRIHRSPEQDDHSAGSSSAAAGGDFHWTWPDAEQRLKAAFEKDGFTGWAEAVLKELEAEGAMERAKRGLSDSTVHTSR